MPVELEFDYDTATASMDKFSQEDIDILRDWSQRLDKSKHVPKDLSDKQLLLFYNACYGVLEKAKQCIEKYYSCRKNSPEFFDNRTLTSDDLKNCMEVLYYKMGLLLISNSRDDGKRSCGLWWEWDELTQNCPEAIGDVLQKAGVRSEKNKRACMKREMDVKEAREVCQDRVKWRSIVSAYPCGTKAEFSFLPEKSIAGYDVIFHRLHVTEPSKYHLEPGCKMLFMTVVETTGCWGAEAKSFIREIGRRLIEQGCDPRTGLNLVQRMAIAIQRGNAASVMGTFAPDACLSKRGPQPGYIFLFDMRGVRLGHLTRVGLVSLRKFFTYIQEAMPVRMREVHVLNTEPILDKLMLLIRPFMDKKLFDLIKFHNKNEDLENFYETVIPRSALPPDYGGTLPDTQTLHKKCMQTLQSMDSYFQTEEDQRYSVLSEKKRGKSLEGNFKNLDID